jgi:hypothetical protein
MPGNCTWDDFNDARTLCEDFNTKYAAHFAKLSREMTAREIVGSASKLVLDIMEKFACLDDMNKDMFRQLLVSKGVETILFGQKYGIDFMQVSSCASPEMGPLSMSLLPLRRTIAMIDAVHGSGWKRFQVDQLCSCPRDLVRIFHRGSACSCLKELYYNLKDNTPKKLRCEGCKEISDLKNIFECSKCETVIYCSRECAVNDWANHKSECKSLCKLRDLIVSKGSVLQPEK